MAVNVIVCSDTTSDTTGECSGSRWCCNKQKKQRQNSQRSMEDQELLLMRNQERFLYAKKVDDRHYPASITKILTTLVAIENNKDLYDEVTFSSYAVNSIEPGSTHIGIKAGEKIPLIDVLNAIMLESANEACNGAAEHTAGTTKKFVELMNKKVKETWMYRFSFCNNQRIA